MRIPVLFLGLLLSLTSAVHGQTFNDARQEQQARARTPTEPFKVIENVYYVGTAGLSSFLVTTPEGHVLIDTAFPDGTPLIKANIEKLGFKLSDIKYLLNSHAYPDHAGGLAEMKKETGALLYASAGDRPLLESGSAPGRDSGAVKFPPVKVDRVIGPGDRLQIGKMVLTATMTPGRSPGCTTWTTVTREQKWNHTVVFFCGASVAGTRLVGNPTYPGIADDYKKTFLAVRGIIADVFLAPRPELFKMEEKRALIGKFGVNPFIRAPEFHAFTREAEKTFNETLAKQTAEASTAAQ